MELTWLKRLINTGDVSVLSRAESKRMSPNGVANHTNLNPDSLPGISKGDIPNVGALTFNSDYLGIDAGKKSILNNEGWGNVLPAAIGFTQNIVNGNKYDTTANDMMADAGMANASIGGIGYRKYNPLDYTGMHAEEHEQNVANTLNLAGSGAATGAALGSIIPGLGTGVGTLLGGAVGTIAGLFGGGSRHAEMRRQQRIAESKKDIFDQVNKAEAYTTYLLKDYLKNHGDTRLQNLYGAKDGQVASSANGLDTPFLAKVSKKEVIVDKYGNMYRVPGKKDNKDTEYAVIRPSDTVVTNKGGLSDYVAATGDVETALLIMMNKKITKAKNGKLPHCVEGWIPDAVSGTLGMLGGLSQYWDAKNQTVKNPNTYVANPYEQSALNDLAGLRVSAYPIIPEIYNQYAKASSAINSSGGLSGGLRTLARLSSMNLTQQNTAKLLQAVQEQNNAYRGNYAQAAINAGQAGRQAKQQANQFDLDYYSRAHAARQQGMQIGMQNFLAQLQNYYANEFKRKQFDKTYDLYAAQNKLSEDELKLKREQFEKFMKNVGLPEETKYYLGATSIGTGDDWASKFLPVDPLQTPNLLWLNTPWGMRSYLSTLRMKPGN